LSPTDPQERRNAAAARQAARLDAVGLAGLATWELDIATGDRYWSAEYQTLYGVDPHELFPTRAAFLAIMHPSDRHVVQDAIDRILSDGTAMEVRYRIIRPTDQAVRTIRSHIRAELDANGLAVRIIGAAQDVTSLVMVLTSRESQMLMLLAEGLSIIQIAHRLVVSPATVPSPWPCARRKSAPSFSRRSRGRPVSSRARPVSSRRRHIAYVS
jgi:DNA-binding CsgD family transcriptional regulator